LRSSFHKALEVDRTVFTREMDITLASLFITAEERILSDQPARVASKEIRITRRITEGGRSRIKCRCARPDLLQLLEEVPSVLPTSGSELDEYGPLG